MKRLIDVIKRNKVIALTILLILGYLSVIFCLRTFGFSQSMGMSSREMSAYSKGLGTGDRRSDIFENSKPK